MWGIEQIRQRVIPRVWSILYLIGALGAVASHVPLPTVGHAFKTVAGVGWVGVGGWLLSIASKYFDKDSPSQYSD